MAQVTKELKPSKSAIASKTKSLGSGKTPKESTQRMPRVDTEASAALPVAQMALEEEILPLGDSEIPDAGGVEAMAAELSEVVRDITATMQPPQLPEASPQALPVEVAELVAWWQERKAALQQSTDVSRQTERTTFHVEQRWVEAIRRQADLDNTTMTQVCNEAFRQYFEGK